MPSARIVTANRPNHVWHVDLTVVPTNAGFWVPWLPFALTSMLVVVDTLAMIRRPHWGVMPDTSAKT